MFSRVKSECGSNMDIVSYYLWHPLCCLNVINKTAIQFITWGKNCLFIWSSSVHKKKILCHLIFIPMHPFLLCFTAFITRLHGIFSQSLKKLLLWVSKYWPEIIFISHQLFLHPINPWLFLWVSLCMSVLFSLCLCSTNSWRMGG